MECGPTGMDNLIRDKPSIASSIDFSSCSLMIGLGSLNLRQTKK